jgi:hypothetical protein
MCGQQVPLQQVSVMMLCVCETGDCMWCEAMHWDVGLVVWCICEALLQPVAYRESQQ